MQDNTGGIVWGLRLAELDAERLTTHNSVRLSVSACLCRKRAAVGDRQLRGKSEISPNWWMFPPRSLKRSVGGGRCHPPSLFTLAMTGATASDMLELTGCGLVADQNRKLGPGWDWVAVDPMRTLRLLWHVGGDYLKEWLSTLPEEFTKAARQAMPCEFIESGWLQLLDAMFAGQSFNPAAWHWQETMLGYARRADEEACAAWLCGVYAWVCQLVWISMACRHVGRVDARLRTFGEGLAPLPDWIESGLDVELSAEALDKMSARVQGAVVGMYHPPSWPDEFSNEQCE